MAGPGNILIKIGAESGQAIAELGKTNKALGDTMTTSEKMGAGLKKAALPAAAALGAIAVGAKAAINSASNLNEQINKTATVFGPASKEMQSWSKTLVHSFGISQEAALEASGTFGNMLVPMGIARGDAAKMSEKMVELAGDMASFNNADPTQTLDALRAGLAGETEPLRKFGVFLNEGRIKAEALSLGLVKSSVNMAKVKKATFAMSDAQKEYAKAVADHGKNSEAAQRAQNDVALAQQAITKAMQGSNVELTAAQKAQASYSLMLKDTKDAQGDFAKTSESAANQSRVQAAEIENLKASLGQSLLPAYELILQTMTKLLGVLSSHQTAIKALTAVVATFAAGILLANAAMKAYALAQKAVKAATVAWTAVQWLLNAALNANPIGLVVVALAALAAGLVIAYKKSETFRSIVAGAMAGVKTAVDAVKNAFAQLWTAATNVFTWIVAHWKLGLFAFGPIGAAVYLITENFDKLKAAGKAAGDAISSAIRGIGAAIDYVIGKVQDLIGALGRIHVPHISLPSIGGLAAPAPTSRAGASSSPAAPVTINVYGSVDPEGTARAIQRTLTARTRRSGYAYRAIAY